MFFSVIIPAYNRASKLPDTLQSVLQQSFSDFELLLIDDGSTDDTRATVAALAAQDKRVRYIYQENQERCIARNNGIEHAHADWICFLDSDDFYKPNHLAELHQLITAYPDKKAFATSIAGASIKNPKNLKILVLKDFWSANDLNLAQLCFNKNALPDLKFPNERMRLGEDLYFIRLLTLETEILQSPIITVYKNEEVDRSDSRIRNPVNTAYEFVEATEKFVIENRKKLSSADVGHMLSFGYLVCSNILMATKNKTKGLLFLRKALRFSATYMHLSFYKAILKILIK